MQPRRRAARRVPESAPAASTRLRGGSLRAATPRGQRAVAVDALGSGCRGSSGFVLRTDRLLRAVSSGHPPEHGRTRSCICRDRTTCNEPHPPRTCGRTPLPLRAHVALLTANYEQVVAQSGSVRYWPSGWFLLLRNENKADRITSCRFRSTWLNPGYARPVPAVSRRLVLDTRFSTVSTTRSSTGPR